MSKFLWWYFEFIFSHWLYHDTLKFSVNYDCIMIQWVSISEMKEAWNGSILLHLPCLYDFGYVHWMYHDTFKLWINIECIMIQSREKPEILSSNCVLIRKPPPEYCHFQFECSFQVCCYPLPPHESSHFQTCFLGESFVLRNVHQILWLCWMPHHLPLYPVQNTLTWLLEETLNSLGRDLK